MRGLFPLPWIEQCVRDGKAPCASNCRSTRRCSEKIIRLSYSDAERLRLYEIVKVAMLP